MSNAGSASSSVKRRSEPALADVAPRADDVGPHLDEHGITLRAVSSRAVSQAQATFCATLADELVARGVRHAVVAPGSRSTPMLLALAARSELPLHVVHDERAAGFVALGLGLSGTPAIVLCTSGTAAANLHPAVVEAGLSGVPMLVLTADRPAELRDVGAPQTIDQTNLYGRAVRWFHDPGVADEAAAPDVALARAAARGRRRRRPGAPEPAVPRAARRRAGSAAAAADRCRRAAWRASPTCPTTSSRARPRTRRRARRRRLATGRDVDVRRGDRLAGARRPARRGSRGVDGAVVAFDALLRHEPTAAALRPEVIVRVGRPAGVQGARPVGRRVGRDARAGRRRRHDRPGSHGGRRCRRRRRLVPLGRRLAGVGDPAWRQRWVDADERAEAAIDAVLGPEAPLTEPCRGPHGRPGAAADAELVVASSMPVRDLEWYGGRAARAHANRGANGIDGVVSTALGVALRGVPTVALVGDIAFVHDAGALTALRSRQASTCASSSSTTTAAGSSPSCRRRRRLPGERFERLFGTPHGTDLVALAAAHGLDATTVTTATELVDRVRRPGPSVTRIATDRAENVRVHAALNAAVAAALA